MGIIKLKSIPYSIEPEAVIAAFKSEVIRSKYVWGAIILSLFILVGIYNIEPMRKILTLYNLSINDWLISIGASAVSLIIIQIGKKLKIAQQ